jgi:hypothetical protein
MPSLLLAAHSRNSNLASGVGRSGKHDLYSTRNDQVMLGYQSDVVFDKLCFVSAVVSPYAVPHWASMVLFRKNI